MREALVIHPRLTVYGGAEMVALHVIKALQDSNFSVSIVTDNYNPAEVEEKFRMGRILEQCNHIRVAPFEPIFPRFLALQRLPYAAKVTKLLGALKADAVFSTQSVLYFVPSMKTCHIVYDIADLFEIHSTPFAAGPLAAIWKKPYYSLLRRTLKTDFKTNRLYIPLSYAIETQLSAYDYPHTNVLFSPCDMIYHPKQKKKQVVLASRIAPQKNIEDFMRIASALPKYPFMLVGVHIHENPRYTEKVLSKMPPNVKFIEGRIRDYPELIEESKVYLYTSLEPGIGIALGQAMGAGCIPVTPAWGGGAEMVSVAKVGYVYHHVAEAAYILVHALESEDIRDSPHRISESSKVFGSERFEKRIGEMLGNTSPL